MGVLCTKIRRIFGSNMPLNEKLQEVRCLFLSPLPLSGRLVTCPWYWEYHSVEFSVPASVENLELSVPTHLVLTFCSNQAFCMTKRKQTRKFCLLFVKLAERLFPEKQKPQKHFSKASTLHAWFWCCQEAGEKWTFPSSCATEHVLAN